MGQAWWGAARCCRPWATSAPGLLGKTQREHLAWADDKSLSATPQGAWATFWASGQLEWGRDGHRPLPPLVLSRERSQKHLPNTKPQDTPLLSLCRRSGQRCSFIMGKLTPMEIKALSPTSSATSNLATCRAGLTPCPHTLQEPHAHCTSCSPGSQHHILLCWGLNVLPSSTLGFSIPL